MQTNSHNTVGQTNSSKLNPARQAREQIAESPRGEESLFGKLVSEIARTTPAAASAPKGST